MLEMDERRLYGIGIMHVEVKVEAML